MAETTTISNLPQITLDELTNDTLVPVENVDGTKAANLGQLRKKLNSLYVEMVDADLNELKQDGIYECWGTTLNAPTSEVAAWIIQTAEHEGVVVQNAFGLGTTSYSYVYRRRWNGVSWTAWKNRILSLEDRAKALETNETNLKSRVKTLEANEAASDLAAVGRIEICGYNEPLPGTLLCNGGAYSRTTYSRLYSKIGTRWGAGDGSTTFNVPNATNRVPFQWDAKNVGKLRYGGVPNITGEIAIGYGVNGTKIYSGEAFSIGNNKANTQQGLSEETSKSTVFNASKVSAAYGRYDTLTQSVIPDHFCVLFCIKY